MKKRLYRSRDERMLAGVAGGLAAYFNVDPTIVRLLFVVAALPGMGTGIVLYLALTIIIPSEPSELGDDGEGDGEAEGEAPSTPEIAQVAEKVGRLEEAARSDLESGE